MATVTIRKKDGSEAGSLDLNDAVFGIEPSAGCVRAVVNQYMANQRHGTAHTKTRANVRGGGRKPFRQKGTGRARQGSIRAIQWVGGGVAFGPQMRSYTYNVNKKVRRKAFCSVWSELIRDERLLVIDSFDMSAPKTKELVGTLQNLDIKGTALLVSEKTDEAMALSARNLFWAKATNADSLNIYDLLTHDYVVVTPEVVKWLEATYA